MRKGWFAVVLVLLWTVGAVAAELKIGDKVAEFQLKDPTGKEYSLDSPEFKGKVLSIFYVDPDEKDTNSHAEDALKADPGLERDKNYKGLGIADLKSTFKPNFIIKSIVKSKQEKTGAIILMDYDHTLVNLWGLKPDSSTLVVVDKERICRYMYCGKLPDDEVKKVIALIKEYQVK